MARQSLPHVFGDVSVPTTSFTVTEGGTRVKVRKLEPMIVSWEEPGDVLPSEILAQMSTGIYLLILHHWPFAHVV